MRTDNLPMSLSSIDDVTSFTIKSLRIIGAGNFLALFQSRLTHVELSFLARAMTLTILLVDLFKTSVAVWVRSCLWIFVGCMDFTHVCVQICAM